jgi:uncharacterized protein (TIGR02145 family)
MNNLIKVTILVFPLLTVVLHSCKKEVLPTLSTSTIFNITATSASSGGNITSDGGAEVTVRGICWGVNANPTTSDSKTSDGQGIGQFVSNLSGLTAGATYHIRAYATNSVGTAYGADLSFVTLGKAPECITQAATNITSSGATLNSTVNANFLSTTVTFEYGITTTYGQIITSAQNPVTGNSITNVSADISSLTPGTMYHFRVIAINSIGTTNGNDLTFTTGAILPTLTSTPFSNKTANSVTTGGNITSDGGASITARGVCWATTPNPTILNNITSDGTGTGSFISNITGLTPGTFYHVRAYATNSAGTAYTNDLTFTTLAVVPTITTATVTDKTQTTANSGGSVSSDGGSEVTDRGVCWSTIPNPTISGSHTSNGTGTGIFTSILTSLTPGTIYYVRAYAINTVGTGYGNEVSFETNSVELATLTTIPPVTISDNIEISGGNITSDGGSSITARGVCWSTTPNPTITGLHTNDGSGSGSFTSNIRCLYGSTIYYVRAYATNIAGTAYGNQQSFITKNDPITFNPNRTYGLVSDIDGNCYKTIQIGNQIWMAENLKTSKYNDGSPIPKVVNNDEWFNLVVKSYPPPNYELTYEITGAYCWYNNDSSTYENDYGKLYNFGVAESGKACPTGWHVPSIIELRILCDPTRIDPFPGNELMESGATHWIDALGTNETGFTALPGGSRGLFNEIGLNGFYWSSDRDSPNYGAVAFFHPIPFSPNFPSTPTSSHLSVTAGLSIRCIKDQ